MTTEAQYYDMYGTYDGYYEPVPCDRCNYKKAIIVKDSHGKEHTVYEVKTEYDCNCYLLYPMLTDMLGDF